MPRINSTPLLEASHEPSELLKQLSVRMTLVFVSHDIGVVATLCEKIVILEKGCIVEAGKTASVLADPRHTYTQRLLASVPRMPA